MIRSWRTANDSGAHKGPVTGLIIASAQRSLYGKTQTQKKKWECMVSSDNISAIMQNLQNISSELKSVNTTLGERIKSEIKRVNRVRV